MEEKRPDISFIMPCLNEENTVGQCVDDAFAFIREHSLSGEVIVVDNDSTDRSGENAAGHGAAVICEERRGYGRAIRTGLENAAGKVIVISDCDTTYDLLHIDGLYFPLSEGECDIVIGDRFAGGMEKGAMPPLHRLGVPFLSWCGRRKYGVDVRDFHCGLRGLTRDALGRVDFTTDGMEFSTEMIALAAKNGMRIAQAPVPLRRCKAERISKLHTFSDGFRHLKYIIFG